MSNIITGKNIVKIFGKGNEQAKALNKVNVEIAKGEFVAVMGPSGSGKSTLLFALSGMDEITSGMVKFGDTELSKLGENALADVRRTKMGFVFQQPTMLRNLNLLDNIILPSAQKGKKDTAKLAQKAKELMNKAGIAGLENRDTTEVSGGQLQRAGICRALMNEPEILFADEPTGALNSKSAEEIMELLVDINKEGTAILLVTHDTKVAAMADRVLFTKDGNIASELTLQKFNGRDRKARCETVLAGMAAVGI
ncbi:putative ABC transport system ATP-binding protein [Lachnotalea glycerini]|uniref:Putative ABC transport system ATP-binding protein n=1 Tax=Lachnotalea glycerini TaxID=1763509 RepID=A0A318ERW7_9FIRM|nr:ABC transporter ATP-binding protein [Lachnotalea glycerini]OYO51524.1 ABC transporter ATP-binding protein [Lachnotalea glycerini]PXV90325.1 putative ABC transport system ATP-binding protein [Lachnotalea glycerini]